MDNNATQNVDIFSLLVLWVMQPFVVESPHHLSAGQLEQRIA